MHDKKQYTQYTICENLALRL